MNATRPVRAKKPESFDTVSRISSPLSSSMISPNSRMKFGIVRLHGTSKGSKGEKERGRLGVTENGMIFRLCTMTALELILALIHPKLSRGELLGTLVSENLLSCLVIVECNPQTAYLKSCW